MKREFKTAGSRNSKLKCELRRALVAHEGREAKSQGAKIQSGCAIIARKKQSPMEVVGEVFPAVVTNNEPHTPRLRLLKPLQLMKFVLVQVTATLVRAGEGSACDCRNHRHCACKNAHLRLLNQTGADGPR